MFSATTRGVSLFLGAFTLLNLAGDLKFAHANGNVWWIDLAPLSLGAERVILALAAVALLAYALAPRVAVRGRAIAVPLLAAVAVGAIVNVVRFYAAIARHAIEPAVPLPLSLIVAAALLLIIAAHLRVPERLDASPLAIGGVCAAMVALFPLAQIVFFGTTDYRRPADVAIVFGARALANGTPSDALADRVRTACELYQAGLVRQLVFSGGPGEGTFTEPAVMRSYAQRLHVPPQAIIEDPLGINTEASVRNTLALVGGARPRVLVVSHFYHLPRIKMAFERYGLDAWTVPSHDSVPFSMPYNLVREDVAFWAYYLRRVV